MKRYCAIAVWSVMAALAVSMSACSKSGRIMDRTWFVRIDDNLDGVITLPELRRFYNTQFDEMDINHNQTLSPGELVAGARKFFQNADANEDGLVTEKEFAAYMIGKKWQVDDDMKSAAKKASGQKSDHGFSTMDVNNDRLATPEEYIVYFANVADEYDLNHSKKISREEISVRERDRFDEIDTDKDGVVTRDEYLRYWAGE